MSNEETFVWILVGVIASVVVPVVARWLSEAVRAAEERTGLWEILVPYLKWGLASLIISTVVWFVVTAAGTRLVPDRFTAFLYGYAWDATLQKVKEARG